MNRSIATLSRNLCLLGTVLLGRFLRDRPAPTLFEWKVAAVLILFMVAYDAIVPAPEAA